MKRLLFPVLFFVLGTVIVPAETVIRVNEMGYYPVSVKIAMLLSDEQQDVKTFQLVNLDTGAVVFEGVPEAVADASVWGKQAVRRLRFTSVEKSGKYVIRAAGVESPVVLIGNDAHKDLKNWHKAIQDRYGVVVRFNPEHKTVYLIFTAHSDLYDGKHVIADTLKAEQVPGSFFFTGAFFADPQHRDWIRRLIDEGHYLGAHSDQHLLYADWNDRSKTLVTRQECLDDLKANFEKMLPFGLTRTANRIYVPPYEYYNDDSVFWCEEFGLRNINFTPRSVTFFDFTTPEMRNYKSSETIFNELKAFEASEANGLNGAILLIHVGTSPDRKDKFYNDLPEVIRWMKQKGYSFGRVDEPL